MCLVRHPDEVYDGAPRPIGATSFIPGANADVVPVSASTALIELQFGPDGALYVAQLDDAGVGAFEEGNGIEGSVRRCSVGACSTVVAGIPILTAIAFRGETLWGASFALVPGLADVAPLLP